MLDLHIREYGSVSDKLYDSLYLGNPYGTPLLGLCFDHTELVGQENYMRQDVVFRNRVIRAAVGINTIVDPRYRLFHGVFGKLCKMTLEAAQDSLDLVCAFANEESKKYYLKYFKWLIASKVRVYKKATTISGWNRESVLALIRRGSLQVDLELEPVSLFEVSRLDPIIVSHVTSSPYAYFYKTADYLNWRFMKSRHYRVSGYQILYRGELCGYLITENHGTEKRILDFLVRNDDPLVLDKTLSVLCCIARNEKIQRIVVYATPGCWYERCLQKRLFFNRWQFDFIARPMNGTCFKTEWVIQIGDFDTI